MAEFVKDENFDAEVLKSDKPVLVDFYAEWCGPCKMMSPIIDELAKEYDGKIKIVKLNVDENQMTAGKYQVMSIPTLFIFKNGEIVEQMVGYQDKSALVARIEGVK